MDCYMCRMWTARTRRWEVTGVGLGQFELWHGKVKGGKGTRNCLLAQIKIKICPFSPSISDWPHSVTCSHIMDISLFEITCSLSPEDWDRLIPLKCQCQPTEPYGIRTQNMTIMIPICLCRSLYFLHSANRYSSIINFWIWNVGLAIVQFKITLNQFQGIILVVGCSKRTVCEHKY